MGLCLSSRHTKKAKIEHPLKEHKGKRRRCAGVQRPDHAALFSHNGLLNLYPIEPSQHQRHLEPSSATTNKRKHHSKTFEKTPSHPPIQPAKQSKNSMGCIHSIPSMRSTAEPQRPVPSRPRPTHSLFYKYHPRPRLPRRTENTLNDLKVPGRKNTGEWNDIESCSLTSLKNWVRQYGCEAGLRWANDDEKGG